MARSIENHRLTDLHWVEQQFALTDSIDEIVPVLILSSNDSTRRSKKQKENVKENSNRIDLFELVVVLNFRDVFDHRDRITNKVSVNDWSN